MKSIRRLFATALLTAILTHAALADDGIIHGDKTPPPPPPPAAAYTTDEASASSLAGDDPVALAVEIALDIVSGPLNLF